MGEIKIAFRGRRALPDGTIRDYGKYGRYEKRENKWIRLKKGYPAFRKVRLELRKHKYIRRKKGKGGKWEYVYKEAKGRSKKIDIKKISIGIKKAIKENPERLKHGYTAKNAFWILEDGSVKKWRGKDIIYKKNVINVHSHSPENYEKEEKNKLQTFSGMDLYALSHMIRRGYGDTTVVISAHGLMDIFKGSERIGEYTKKMCEYERLLTKEVEDKIAKKHKLPLKGRMETIFRMVLREIAKGTNSTYLEKVKWK